MNNKSLIFSEILSSIENDKYRDFARALIETIPDYFWDIGASSTGKYHPEYTLGDLGLARHTVALVRILNHMLTVESMQSVYDSEKRDCLRIAGMMHDTRKCGNEYKKFTTFDHPLLAGQVVRNVEFDGDLSSEDREFIATCIESHMGQWNTDRRSSITLPKPETASQRLLHLCDYLASRKDILIDFGGTAKRNENAKSQDNYNPDTYCFTFGKHTGKSLDTVMKEAPYYINWCVENIQNMNLVNMLKIFLEKHQKGIDK